MKRILALDLSLSGTGYCLPSGITGKLEPPKSVGLGEERLDWILSHILELAEQRSLLGVPYTPADIPGKFVDVVVIEGYAFSSQTSHVRAIAELGGLVRWALWKKRIPFAEIPPTTLKKYATGKGNAKKPELLAEAIKRLDFMGHDDNEVDALWLWVMALDAYGLGPVSMPQLNRETLKVIRWPGLPAPEPKPRKKRKVAHA